MKRDMELIKSILLEIEKAETWQGPPTLKIEGYSEEEINFHLLLLVEAGLIKAVDLTGFDKLDFMPERLTWEGYEFLEATKNQPAWNKTKEIMAKSGGFVVEIAKSILVELIKRQLTGAI